VNETNEEGKFQVRLKFKKSCSLGTDNDLHVGSDIVTKN
jgi:hypothetical protein